LTRVCKDDAKARETFVFPCDAWCGDIPNFVSLTKNRLSRHPWHEYIRSSSAASIEDQLTTLVHNEILHFCSIEPEHTISLIKLHVISIQNIQQWPTQVSIHMPRPWKATRTQRPYQSKLNQTKLPTYPTLTPNPASEPPPAPTQNPT
jgi:hypothetical protein